MTNSIDKITPIENARDNLILLRKHIKKLKEIGETMSTGAEKLQEVAALISAARENLAGDLERIIADLNAKIEALANAATAEQIEEILGGPIADLQALADQNKAPGEG